MHLRNVPGKLTSGMYTLNEWEDLVIKGKGLAASFLIFRMSLQPNLVIRYWCIQILEHILQCGHPKYHREQLPCVRLRPMTSPTASKALNSKGLSFELESICKQENILKYGYAYLVPMVIAFLCVLLHTTRYKFRVAQRKFCSGPNTAFPGIICLV